MQSAPTVRRGLSADCPKLLISSWNLDQDQEFLSAKMLVSYRKPWNVKNSLDDIERSQRQLRDSIEQTKRLSEESDVLIDRHRSEREGRRISG